MKRAREDSAPGPQAKRPASVSGESSEQPRLTTEDALQYLKAVKEKFKDDNSKYSEFLEVMKDFKAQRIDTAGVIGRVKDLFKGHNNLILGFNAFLPKNFQIVLPDENSKKQPVEFDQAINFVNKIKNRFNDNEQVYKAFLEILNKYRKATKSINEVYDEVASLFKDHPDLLDEFTRFLPDSGNAVTTTTIRQTSNQRKDEKVAPARSSQFDKVAKKEAERKAERERKRAERERERERNDEQEKDREELDREADADGQRLPHKRKSARRADELIRRQSQTQEGASTQMEYAFFEKVKSRLRNRESYRELLKILNLYNEQIITRAELHSLATDILGKHPDLLEGFNNLLIQCENGEGCLGGVFKRLESEGVTTTATKAKEKDQEKEEKDKEKVCKDQKSILNKDKFVNKPISELDLSGCESCTPSYRLLPKNYPRLASSHRNELATSVLNDVWVSVTSGSEDSSFKHMRRNQYEESLFRCEDDRFELDMLLESTALTAKRIGEIVDKLDSGQLEPTIRIDDYLTAINMRCIERIYGDHGLDIIDLMRRNASAVLPVVHCRLRQKQDEWAKCRADMNKVWAEVYAKNYHKSLDHRSFYFKQQDKKSLSTKGLLSEIKETHERKKKEDESVLHMVMGNRRLPAPEMSFPYPDASVHEDLFQIMKFSADEVCNTMEQSDKVMRIWTLFLEFVFGLPPRPRGSEAWEDGVKSGGGSKEQRSSSGESAASGGPGSPPDNSKQGHEECGTASSLPEARRKNKAEGNQEAENPRPSSRGTGNFTDKDIDEAVRNSLQPDKEANAKKEPRSNAYGGKAEREEGELSPSLDSDKTRPRKNSISASGNTNKKRGGGGPEYNEAEGEAEVEAEAEAEVEAEQNAEEEGEESRQKSSDDSENENSEGGEEVSNSDAGDNSHDEHEEEEEDDDKPESECDGLGDDAEAVDGPDRFSMFCKPIAVHPGCLSNQPPPSSFVFYGSDMFYILFRLHQTLYERILSAKTNSTAAEQKWKSMKENKPANFYDKFVRVLYDLLDGTADNAKFEDECRSLIGTQSFVLFTLDKLIYKLVKQLQNIAADEIAVKLLALHSYQKSRACGEINDVIYHANACILLHDENIYRFEIASNATELSIQLMSPMSGEKLESPVSAMESTFSRYLSDFLSTSSSPPVSKGIKPVFLKRSKLPTDAAMENTKLVNGVEHKICCKSSKVSYVLDTEDVFHRFGKKRKRVSPSARNRRASKFRGWINERLKALQK